MSFRFLILIILFSLMSCSQFRTGRTYMAEMSEDDSRFFEPNSDFPIVAGDTGRYWISDGERARRTPASKEERDEDIFESSLKYELRSLENSLSSDEEKVYMKYRGDLRTISERIYFLKLSDYERRDYLISRGLIEVKESAPTLQIAGTQGVKRGMSKSEVVTSLGNPARIDVAGNPQNENERWLYTANGTQKYIYFEAGTVFGWE